MTEVLRVWKNFLKESSGFGSNLKSLHAIEEKSNSPTSSVSLSYASMMCTVDSTTSLWATAWSLRKDSGTTQRDTARET